MAAAAVKRSWRWYVRLLDRRPLLAQASTTGFVCGLGDLIAQHLTKQHSWREHDWNRTAKMTSIGFFFTGPVLRGWFVCLDRVFGPSQSVAGNPDAAVVLKKLSADQFLFAPVLIFSLLQLFGLSQGLDFQARQKKVEKEYFSVLFSCYRIWPLANLVNFFIIPLKFRVNYTNVISLGWNTYLAWVAHR